MDIHELNKRRALLWMAVQAIEQTNMPTDPEQRLELDCRARLVRDAWIRAEHEYSSAMLATPTEALIALAGKEE